jgi:TolC family type I secretion outer membrane protein
MRKWFPRGVLVWLAVAMLLPAGSSAAATLEAALAKAYETNPAMLAARAKLRAEDETLSEAASGWRPSLDVSVDVGKSHSDTSGGSSSSAGTQNRTPRSGSMTVSQNLYRGGRTVAETRRTENSIKAERARLGNAERTVLLDAATAYMDVIRDRAVLALNENNEKVLRKQQEAAKDRFRVGEVTRTDVAQAESRLSRAIADRIQAEGAVISSRAVYRNVIGDTPGTLQSAQPLGGLPATEIEAVKLAEAGEPGVIAAKFEERAARDRVRVIFGEFLPSFDLEGELRRRDEASSTTSRSETATFTATLTIPLYQAGSVSARVREAKQIAAQRRNEVDSAIRNAVEEATKAWEALATTRARIEAFTAEVRAATIALEGVEQEAKVGSRTILDVLDAEQELLDAKVSLVRVERDEVVASFGLMSAAGSLSARNLGLPVKLYDTDAYLNTVRNKWFGTGISP